jgi:hypothetical protein
MKRREQRRQNRVHVPVTVSKSKYLRISGPVAQAALETLTGPTGLDVRPDAPLTRADCYQGLRPCPWVSCRHHLAIDVTKAGGLTISWPFLQIGEVPYSCSLDVADDYPEGLSCEAVGAMLNVSHQRIDQILTRLKPLLREKMKDHK